MEELFVRACSGRMKGNGFKQREADLDLDRKKLLNVMVVRY